MTLEKLKQFRTGVYTILGNAKGALFDLMDAMGLTQRSNIFVIASLRSLRTNYRCVSSAKNNTSGRDINLH